MFSFFRIPPNHSCIGNKQTEGSRSKAWTVRACWYTGHLAVTGKKGKQRTVARLFYVQIMKKYLLSLVLALLSVTAHSEIWYYINSGHEPETYNGQVRIVIRDNNGQLWQEIFKADEVRNYLLRDRNFFINLFNSSIVGGKHDANGYPVTDPYGKPYYRSYARFGYFHKLVVQKRTSKCNVLQEWYLNGLNGIGCLPERIAISLDYKTYIYNCEVANPVYFVSVPVERFIVRKSVDDLF